MDAIVEVATAKMVAQTGEVTAVAKTVMVFAIAKVAIREVATFTKHVLSIAGTSISAVSPDNSLIGGTA